MIKLSELPDLHINMALWRGVDGIDGKPGESITGPQGLRGDPGKDGINGSGFVWCGEWKRSTTYNVNDVVGLEGSSYVCAAPSMNNRPHVTSRYWNLLAARGERGERGEQGAAGQRGRSVRIEVDGNRNAAFFDSAAARGNAVFVSSDNHVDLAQADSEATSGVVGLSTAARQPGDFGEYVVSGPFRNDAWSWTPGAMVYLSPSVPGGLTQTPAASAGQLVTYMGMASTPTEIILEIERGILIAQEPEA